MALAAAPASAQRPLLEEAALHISTTPTPTPPPEAQIEGACGLAFGPGGALWVSDHYHQLIDRFKRVSPSGFAFDSQLSTAGPPQGPCGLALDSAGALYANVWHQSVIALLPSPFTIDTANPTGVAVDQAGNLYVNERTRIAKYEAPVGPGATPAQIIGSGSLTDAYGLAAFEGRLYVPDAATKTIKVFESSVDPLEPAFSIAHNFKSLKDASVAVDPTNGHLLVVDNTQPGFVHPRSAIHEFGAKGEFLDLLEGAPVNAEPAGIAVDPTSGELYVTDGNSEGANVFHYGPYAAGSSGGGGEALEGEAQGPGAAEAVPPVALGEAVPAPAGEAALAVAAPPTAARKHPRRGHRRGRRHRGPHKTMRTRR
jgi:hypothetical protein